MQPFLQPVPLLSQICPSSPEVKTSDISSWILFGFVGGREELVNNRKGSFSKPDHSALPFLLSRTLGRQKTNQTNKQI